MTATADPLPLEESLAAWQAETGQQLSVLRAAVKAVAALNDGAPDACVSTGDFLKDLRRGEWTLLGELLAYTKIQGRFG